MNHLSTQELANTIMIPHLLFPQNSQFSFRVFPVPLRVASQELEHSTNSVQCSKTTKGFALLTYKSYIHSVRFLLFSLLHTSLFEEPDT